LYNRAQKTNIV